MANKSGILDDNFDAVFSAMVTDAVSFIDQEISPDRAKAMHYFRGDPFGDETEGRSKVVIRDVHDTIITIIPSVQRTFFGAEKPVEYAPRMPEDVQAAEQATDFANYVLEQDNDWYSEFNDISFDAMLFGDGFGVVYVEDQEHVNVEQYTGLDDMQLAILASEAEVEAGQQEDGSYDAIVRRKTSEKCYKVRAIAPEEFIIDRRATSFDDAEIVGQRTFMTVADLVEMGYDRDEMIENAGGFEINANDERIARNKYQTYDATDSVNPDLQRVVYVEAYTKYDMDGDGYAELLKVCAVGSGYKVVKVEPVNEIPLFKLSMFPNPHSFWSQGMYDRLCDLQRIDSQVMRLTLDSMAQSIYPDSYAVRGRVSMEDVLNNELGRIIRVDDPTAFGYISKPANFQAALPMMDYLRQVKERRTGINDASIGINADAISNVTREMAAAAVGAGQGQIELICRNFANGLKRMYKLLLVMMVRHQDKPRMMRLRNEWIPIDPRSWNANMDASVNVALSNGTIQQRAEMLSYQAEKQSEAISSFGPDNGIVTLGQYRSTMAKIAELAGFKDSSQFWVPVPMDYTGPQQPESDPTADATQALVQVEQQKAELQFQSQVMRAESDLTAKREKMEYDAAIQSAKIEQEQQKLDMQRQQMILDLEMQRAKLLQQMAKEEREAVRAAYDLSQQTQQDASQQSDMSQALVALGQMIVGLKEGQEDIAEAVSAPKQVVRDDMGRIVGVVTVNDEGSDDAELQPE